MTKGRGEILILTLLCSCLACGCSNRAGYDKEVDYQWFIEPGTYEDIKLLDHNLIAVEDSSGKYGFIDGKANPIVECQYFNILGVGEEIVRVMDLDHQFLFVDYQGNPIGEETFQDTKDFSEGLAAVMQDGKWGFIDRKGDLVIEYQYDDAGSFGEGKAAVMKIIDGYRMWAYINAENEVVLNYRLYDSSEGRIEIVGEFEDGYALVTDGLYCLINEQGKVVLGNASSFLTAGGICDPSNGYLIAYDYADDAMTEKKYGVINVDGEEVVPFVFDYISEIREGLAVVKCIQENDLETGVIQIDANQSSASIETTEEIPIQDMEQEQVKQEEMAILATSTPAAEVEETSPYSWIETQDEYEAARYKSNGELEVSVERTSRPITNEKGEILAQVYYERPVVSGDTEAARKINEFYEREEQEWFDGYGRNTLYIDEYYSYFYEQVMDRCDMFGEDYVIEHPSRYTIKTRIMFLDEKLLSVLQINDVYNGHIHPYYLGSTFDLETGELLSIDELADIDADRLKGIINDALYEDNTYDELEGKDYVTHYYDREIAMNYEYYYDGEKFYIILNIIEGSLDGVIATWNGKWGDEYAVGRFSYFIQPDGEMLKKTVW